MTPTHFFPSTFKSFYEKKIKAVISDQQSLNLFGKVGRLFKNKEHQTFQLQ